MRHTLILFLILLIAPLGELLARFNVHYLAAERAETCAKAYEIFFVGDPPNDIRTFWFNDCLCMDKYCFQDIGGNVAWVKSYFAYCANVRARSCTNCPCALSFPGTICRYNDDGFECNTAIRVAGTMNAEEVPEE